jgi:hypothetical protein
VSSKHSVWINLSFDLFIFVLSLFHTVFGVQLRVSAFINVPIGKNKNSNIVASQKQCHFHFHVLYLLKYFQRNMHILELTLQFVNLLQALYHRVSTLIIQKITGKHIRIKDDDYRFN